MDEKLELLMHARGVVNLEPKKRRKTTKILLSAQVQKSVVVLFYLKVSSSQMTYGRYKSFAEDITIL